MQCYFNLLSARHEIHPRAHILDGPGGTATATGEGMRDRAKDDIVRSLLCLKRTSILEALSTASQWVSDLKDWHEMKIGCRKPIRG